MPLRVSTVFLNALSLQNALDETEPPAAPTWPLDASMTEARAEELMAHFDGEEPLESPVTKEEKAQWRAFVKARDRWRATKSKQRGKVLACKFSSNDGWIVSATEARVIAKQFASLLRDEEQFSLLCDVLDLSSQQEAPLRKTLQTFQRFNARAAKHGGYSVS